MVSVAAAGLLSGCMAVEENPLNVNTAEEVPANASLVQPQASDVPAALGEDPLQLGINGSKLCMVQPDGFQEFTVLIHNQTLETFTLDDVRLGDGKNLTLISAEASPANREGHHGASGSDAAEPKSGGHGEGHATGSASAEATKAPSTLSVDPVPAVGYEISTLEYVNVVLAVSINDGADEGTAKNIEIDYSSADRTYEATHNLELQLGRESCK